MRADQCRGTVPYPSNLNGNEFHSQQKCILPDYLLLKEISI